jgi:hypothetical protein
MYAGLAVSMRFCPILSSGRLIARLLRLLQNILSSVADPDHFDADPDTDPTSEKPGRGSGSNHALYKIV